MKLRNISLSGLFLATALLLPFLTGQIGQIGNMLCPMHIPALLCGFICGPVWGALVGFISPLLRFLLWGMPPIFPTGIAMAFELCTYGLASGLLYSHLPKKVPYIYVNLLISMVAGRIIWGAVRFFISSFAATDFSFAIFIADGFTKAIPGIILQIIIIPPIVAVLKKSNKKTAH